MSELRQKKFFGVNYGVISTPKFVHKKITTKNDFTIVQVKSDNN